MRIDRLNEEATAPSTPIPLPSGETLMKLGQAAVALFIMGGLSFLIAKSDLTVGYGLTIIGGGMAVGAQCLIIARLLDEDFLTIAMVSFIPMYDVFYFITNIWEYFPYFCMKYGGIVVAIAAAAGMAAK